MLNRVTNYNHYVITEPTAGDNETCLTRLIDIVCRVHEIIWKASGTSFERQSEFYFERQADHQLYMYKLLFSALTNYIGIVIVY